MQPFRFQFNAKHLSMLFYKVLELLKHLWCATCQEGFLVSMLNMFQFSTCSSARHVPVLNMFQLSTCSCSQHVLVLDMCSCLSCLLKKCFTVSTRVEWFFFILQKTALNQMSGMILEVQIQIFGLRAHQSFDFQKIRGGLNINNFFVKIGRKLPFTLKNKCRNTNLKFEF